ncbi:unnamed protein product [Urochloa humidicola]
MLQLPLLAAGARGRELAGGGGGELANMTTSSRRSDGGPPRDTPTACLLAAHHGGAHPHNRPPRGTPTAGLLAAELARTAVASFSGGLGGGSISHASPPHQGEARPAGGGRRGSGADAGAPAVIHLAKHKIPRPLDSKRAKSDFMAQERWRLVPRRW